MSAMTLMGSQLYDTPFTLMVEQKLAKIDR